MIASSVLALSALLYWNGHVAGACYWNNLCPYQLLGTKTPYDTVRGDIREIRDPENCSPISVWALFRHGNRNPGDDTVLLMKAIGELRDDIVQSYERGTSQLCAQDIEDLKKWQWDPSLEVLESMLVEAGKQELFHAGQRIRERYPFLLENSPDKFYFRATTKERAIDSGEAFLLGLADSTTYNFTMDTPSDELIRLYSNCDRFQEWKDGPVGIEQTRLYYETAEFRAVQSAVQARLGISRQLSAEDIITLYDKCRYYRSWSENLRSPWCAAFTDEELEVLEYGDDVDQYYKNGHGSWLSAKLGEPVLKDLYDRFQASVARQGKNIVSYFSHNSMMHLTYSALGLYKDSEPLLGDHIKTDRLWRSSENGVLANNLIAVLNRCQESNNPSYRVQIFVNEKVTELCPIEGCTWAEFQTKFQDYSDNLDFCSLNYTIPEDRPNGSWRQNAGSMVFGVPFMLLSLLQLAIIFSI